MITLQQKLQWNDENHWNYKYHFFRKWAKPFWAESRVGESMIGSDFDDGGVQACVCVHVCVHVCVWHNVNVLRMKWDRESACVWAQVREQERGGVAKTEQDLHKSDYWNKSTIKLKFFQPKNDCCSKSCSEPRLKNHEAFFNNRSNSTSFYNFLCASKSLYRWVDYQHLVKILSLKSAKFVGRGILASRSISLADSSAKSRWIQRTRAAKNFHLMSFIKSPAQLSCWDENPWS